MIWKIIKNSAADIWDEMLYLMIFNIIWFISLLLVIPWPLVTFGLFFTIYDVGEAKGIGFGTLWQHARRMWRQAYLWGGINLAIFVLAWINLNFYARVGADWAGLAQMLVLALLLFWLILQLIALPFYPRLERPGLKLALRNAAVTIGRYPLATFALVIIVGLILAIAFIFPLIFFLGAFSVIAVVANRLVAAVVAKEKREEEERGAGSVRREA
ncbi:MAG: hypothetical protein HS126_05180 [Anaerolineales bacterium]|nr:hypothetical protein [Anaerolineales bacterium]